MKRTVTGLCVAAAFGFVASLGAQTSTPSQTPTTSDSKDITVTGCLERGANGNYMLANAHMDQGMDRSTGMTGTTGTTGTSTTATGTSASSSSATSMSAASWKLEGGSDLDKHVGHKVSVTGHEVSASDRNEASTSTSAGTTGTTATTSTTGTTGSQASSQRQTSDSGHKLDVKSVKMVAATCS